MKSMLTDTLGFAGINMLRRIVAHVEDLKCIAVCWPVRTSGLHLGKTYITAAASFKTMDDAIWLARETP
jgi:5-methylthioribose kinase